MSDSSFSPTTDSFTVSYASADQARLEPQPAVLEERWLHKLFLLSHRPADWPGWRLAAGLGALALLVGLMWLPVGAGPALAAAGIYLAFALADWGLVWWLPRTNRSYGPVGPQLFVKTVPRLGTAGLAALVAWAGETASLGLFLLLLFQGLGTAIYLWGTLYEPFALGRTTWPLESPALGSSNQARPLRLLHLSDLHIERLTRREEQLLALVSQARPDLIVITGDYLNLSYVDEPIARAHVQRLLARLEAPYGVYATLGSPPVDPRTSTPSLFEGTNIRLLQDEVAVLTLADGRRLSLLGLNCEHDLASDSSAFRQLVELAPADSTRILLYHSPELMPLVRDYPIDLYLCGHTHGGQIRLPLYGAILTSSVTGKRYEMGPYLEQETTLYVSRGIGLEGLSAPRMRLLCPPEIVLFTLTGPNGRM